MTHTRFLRLKSAICVLPWLLTAPVFADAGDPPGRVARLSYTKGSVSLQPSGESQWTQASTNYVVTTGDRLYTDQDSRAELEVGPFAVHMSQTTDLVITNLDDRLMQLGLGQGSIRLTVFDLAAENSVEIDTPNGALTVLRAGSYRVDTNPDTGSTLVSVNSGSLEVSGGGVSQTVQGGRAVQLTGTGPIQISPVALPNNDEFDQWCETRDRRIRSFASRQYVNPYIPGVVDLDAYGRWHVEVDYGPVWYPATVPVGWVPYRFGRWVWIEPWGWTWVEDEPWGFCQFHYGRWALIGSVWGWVPGPVTVIPVYAPAFVAFLGGGGFSVGVAVQAWFPLGPGEPFFPWYHHGREYLRAVNITNVRNATNITNIINVTNVNNIHYAYKTVATTAVPADVFRRGQPVAHQVVRVPPQHLAKAQVVPHPNVVPAPTAAFGGRGPIKPPPVRTARLTTRAVTRGAPASSGDRRASQPPLVTRNAPPARPEAGQAARMAPPAVSNNAPVERRTPSGPPPGAPPHFITRTPPPPHNVPFSARQPVLSVHPGRPLEPQQWQNLQAKRPAGPMLDREFPPHPPQWRSPPPAVRPPERPSRRRP